MRLSYLFSTILINRLVDLALPRINRLEHNRSGVRDEKGSLIRHRVISLLLVVPFGGGAAFVQVTSSVQDLSQLQEHQVYIDNLTQRARTCKIAWAPTEESGNSVNGNSGALVPAYPGFGVTTWVHCQSPQNVSSLNYSLIGR